MHNQWCFVSSSCIQSLVEERKACLYLAFWRVEMHGMNLCTKGIAGGRGGLYLRWFGRYIYIGCKRCCGIYGVASKLNVSEWIYAQLSWAENTSSALFQCLIVPRVGVRSGIRLTFLPILKPRKDSIGNGMPNGPRCSEPWFIKNGLNIDGGDWNWGFKVRAPGSSEGPCGVAYLCK